MRQKKAAGGNKSKSFENSFDCWLFHAINSSKIIFINISFYVVNLNSVQIRNPVQHTKRPEVCGASLCVGGGGYYKVTDKLFSLGLYLCDIACAPATMLL